MHNGDTIEKKLRNAGVDVDAAQLTETAYRCLKASRRNAVEALPAFVRAVADNPTLLIALMGWEVIHDRAERYLKARAHDMRGGASQSRHDSHHGSDRPAAPDSAPNGRHDGSGSHVSPCRPAGAPTKISRTAARRVATGYWELKLGKEVNIGEVTYQDTINLQRRGMIEQELASRLLSDPRINTADWKHGGPLYRFAERADVLAILNEVTQTLPPPERRHHV